MEPYVEHVPDPIFLTADQFPLHKRRVDRTDFVQLDGQGLKPSVRNHKRHSGSRSRQTKKFVLYRERYSLPMKLQGLSPGGMFDVCVPLDHRQDLSYWGTSYSEASMVTTLPGSVDAVLGSAYSHVIALIAIEHL